MCLIYQEEIVKKPFLFAFLVATTFLCVSSLAGCDKLALRTMVELPPSTEKKIVIEKNLMVPMRDGVKLATDIYRPASGGPRPVILVRIPYNKEELLPPFGKMLARRGYVCIAQDCRGTFRSEGQFFFPLFREAEDGVDTVEWIAKQPWFDGNLGTWGGSYFGYTQWALAPSNKRLKCFYPLITSPNMTEVFYVGGAIQHELTSTWSRSVGKQSGNINEVVKVDLKGGLYNLPINPSQNIDLKYLAYNIENPDVFKKLFNLDILPPKAGLLPPELLTKVTNTIMPLFSYPSLTMDHEELTYDDRYKEVSAPALGVAGWYDIFTKAQLNDFNRLWKEGQGDAASHSKLIIGPWGHGVAEDLVIGNDKTASTKAMIQAFFKIEWYDRWLKGKKNGIEEGAPLKIYVMGANKWREENEWPLARMKPVNMYLHSGGKANTLNGDGKLSMTAPTGEEPADNFVYNPADPVPTTGGSNLVYNVGPAYQNKVEERNDVLVYTTDALTEDFEATGPIYAVIYASTDAVDTDWTVKLVDVGPDGRAINIQDGIIRTRYRDGLKKPSLLNPKEIYCYTIDLWATSYVFKQGHRIRIEVSSSNFPRFERNSGLAGKGGPNAFTVANQIIYHDSVHQSHIVLPLIPPSAPVE